VTDLTQRIAGLSPEKREILLRWLDQQRERAVPPATPVAEGNGGPFGAT